MHDKLSCQNGKEIFHAYLDTISDSGVYRRFSRRRLHLGLWRPVFRDGYLHGSLSHVVGLDFHLSFQGDRRTEIGRHKVCPRGSEWGWSPPFDRICDADGRNAGYSACDHKHCSVFEKRIIACRGWLCIGCVVYLRFAVRCIRR